MSQIITKRIRLSRRTFLKGLTATHVAGPRRRAAADFDVQFDGHGVRGRLAGDRTTRRGIDKRFVSGSTATVFRSATGSRRAPGRTTT